MKNVLLRMDIESSLEQIEFNGGPIQNSWIESPQVRKKSCMKRIFRPILIMMAVSGLYNFSDLYDLSTSKNRKTSMKSVLSYIYRFFVLGLILTMLGRFIAAFFYLPPQYHQLLGLCIIFISSLIFHFFIFLKTTSDKFGNYEATLQFWEEKIIPELKALDFECPIKSIKLRAMITTIVACVCIVINVIGTGVQVLQFNSGPLYMAPVEINTYTIIFFFILQLYSSFVWIIPHANVIILSRTLTRQFQSFNKYLADTIENQGSVIPANFQKLRLLHTDLSKLISDFDKDFGWFCGISLAFHIALNVFSLYQIIKTDMDTMSMVMFLFWFSIVTIMLGTTTIFAALLNEEVSNGKHLKLFSSIEFICTKKKTRATTKTPSLFLQRRESFVLSPLPV